MSLLRKFFLSLASLASILGLFSFSPAFAADPRSQTVWTISGTAGALNVIPYLRGDKRSVFVDFESSQFDNINYIYFNLTYSTTANGGTRGIEGTFWPEKAKWLYYNDVPYQRREFLLGTCSKGVCTYDPNISNLKITINTKMKTGSQVDTYTQILSINY